jgi:hypothetical protein
MADDEEFEGDDDEEELNGQQTPPLLSRQNSGKSLKSGKSSSNLLGTDSLSGKNKTTSVKNLIPLFPSLKKKPKEKDILALYETGNLSSLLNDNYFTETDKIRWLHLWLQIDVSGQNRVNFAQFMEYFLFPDNVFSRKVFEIANSDLTAVLTFREFMEFCMRYLIVDKDSLQEFAFRIVLRQSAKFIPTATVIETADLKYFITNRYNITDTKDLKRKALALLKEMDGGNSSLALDLVHFKQFCKINHSMEVFAAKFIVHLRNFILGNDFWVQKSRQLKKKRLTGLSSLTPLKRTNIDSEIYMNALGVPVVDPGGRPLKMASEKAGPSSEATANDGGDMSSMDDDVSSIATSRQEFRSMRSGSIRSMVREDVQSSSRSEPDREGGRADLGSLSRESSVVSMARTDSVKNLLRSESMERSVSQRGLTRGDSDLLSKLTRTESNKSIKSEVSSSVKDTSALAVKKLWTTPFDHARY